ncbi:unnamed protein product [Ostreobium quekettii]|uniref:Uncharacterized protein n=1 Tax=Ostreobium quekettii TaxID=121088 RepID=A0A8S1J2H0_9CHLO|nr:unnamed protein product [Ostreobium quekettii]
MAAWVALDGSLRSVLKKTNDSHGMKALVEQLVVYVQGQDMTSGIVRDEVQHGHLKRAACDTPKRSTSPSEAVVRICSGVSGILNA